MANRTITIETSDEEYEAVKSAIQPYRKEISQSPELLSLLYDVDLMPEQIKLMVNARRMIGYCLLHRRIRDAQMPTEKQIEAAAKAICKARYGHLRGYIGREQFYEEEARAALEAAEKEKDDGE